MDGPTEQHVRVDGWTEQQDVDDDDGGGGGGSEADAAPETGGDHSPPNAEPRQADVNCAVVLGDGEAGAENDDASEGEGKGIHASKVVAGSGSDDDPDGDDGDDCCDGDVSDASAAAPAGAVVALAVVGCSFGLANPRTARDQSWRTRRAMALVRVDGGDDDDHDGSSSHRDSGDSDSDVGGDYGAVPSPRMVQRTTLLMVRCTVAGSTSHGVSLAGRGSALALRSCVVRNNAACGVQCMTADGTHGGRLRVDRTLLANNGGPAVRIFDSDTFAASIVGRHNVFEGNNRRWWGDAAATSRAVSLASPPAASEGEAEDPQAASTNGHDVSWDLGPSFHGRVRAVDEASFPTAEKTSTAPSTPRTQPQKRARVDGGGGGSSGGGLKDCAMEPATGPSSTAATVRDGRFLQKPSKRRTAQFAVHVYGPAFDLSRLPRGRLKPVQQQQQQQQPAGRRRRKALARQQVREFAARACMLGCLLERAWLVGRLVGCLAGFVIGWLVG